MAEQVDEDVLLSPENSGVPTEVEETKGKLGKLIPVLVIIPVMAALAFFLVTRVINPRLMSSADDLLVMNSDEMGEEPENVVWQLGTKVTNLSGSNKLRFIKISVSLNLASVAVQEKVEKEREKLGDIFLTKLSSKTFDEMKSPDGKRELKDELKESFTTELYLAEGDIVQVYFDEFIIQ